MRSRRFTAAPLIAAVLATGAGADFESSNITLLSHIPAADFPGAPSRGNDCWGYVSPSGREYALMGMRNALAVVEVTDPSLPVIVASIPHDHSNWSDVKTYQHHAYVVNEEGGGIDVIDLTEVDEGVVTLVQRVTQGGVSSSHNVAIDETSGFLYLCGSNIEGGRLVAFDLADPANPVLAGAVPASQGAYSHDAQIVTYTEGIYAGLQVAFSADGAFGLSVYLVSDKSNMTRLAAKTYPNLGYSHQCWLSGDRQHLYLNDELDGVNETVIFDVSNITNPVMVGSYSSGVESIDHNLYWHEGFIYEAEYTAGLRMFDASDPLNPVQVGWFDTYPGSDAAEFSSAWSVYPFFPSGNVLISTKNEGLFVVRPGPPPLAFAYPGGLPARLDPDGDTIQVQITGQGGESLAAGTAMLHYDDGGGGGLVSVPMSPLGGGLYEGAFGPLRCGELIQFHVSAKTTSNITMTDPIGAPATLYGVVAADDSTVALDDDMESDAGWIVGVPGDDATTGTWTRVEPIGTEAQPEADHTAQPGALCWVTGQGNPNGLVGDADVDDGTTTLVSPRFDLDGAADAVITYWRWYDNDFFQFDSDEGQSPSEDVFVIDISNDDGATWTNVETIGPLGPGTSGGWILHAVNVADFLAPTATVRLRFVASDLVGFSIVEAAVDDVRVEEVVCDGAIVGDLDDDGDVDVEDLVALILAWGPCAGCPEDLDGSGVVDVSDLVALILNWG